jgi:hypothetical protein
VITTSGGTTRAAMALAAAARRDRSVPRLAGASGRIVAVGGDGSAARVSVLSTGMFILGWLRLSSGCPRRIKLRRA